MLNVTLAPTQYGLMMDAGSSGTRIHIYEWPSLSFLECCDTDIVVIPQHILEKKVSPGMSHYALNPGGAGAGDSLKPLVEHAKAWLRDKLPKGWSEEKFFSSIPIYIRATAGMRQIPPKEQTAVFDNVKAYLSTAGFLFFPEHASVISGEEEGVFGWLTVNTILGLFSKKHKRLTGITSGHGDESVGADVAGGEDENDESEDQSSHFVSAVGSSFSSSELFGENGEFRTVGALDLGGASAQITFIPERDVLQNVFNLRVRNTNIRLYTHSFLHYGRNEADNRVSADIISNYLENDVGSTSDIVHPCYPTGYTFQPSFVTRSKLEKNKMTNYSSN